MPSGEENEGWSNAPLRILYLTKDQNSQDCGAWDVREECYHNPNSEIEDNILRRQFPIHKNLVFSLYGIVESLRDHVPSYKEIETKALDKEILKISDEYPFARINCKKIIGTSECTDATLEEYLLKATDYLKKQILSLEPDLILCCGSRNGNNLILNFLSKNCYNLQDTERGSYSVHYDSEKNVAAIDAYHLSYFQREKAYEKYYEETVLTWDFF